MKTRILSAIVMLAIAVPILFFGGSIFDLFVAIIGVFGLKELFDTVESKRKIPLFVKILGFILFLFFVFHNYGKGLSASFDYSLLVISIFALLMPVLLYQDDKFYNMTDGFSLFGMIAFLGIAFHYAIQIRHFSLEYLLYLLIIVMATDSFAFFTGYLIGKHKAVPKISPGKTVEGYLGGLFFGTLFGTILYLMCINSRISLGILIPVSFFLSIVTALGDLAFSALKREYHKKDFSNLIPGHGGILDRFDSLIFVLLAFGLLINFI